MSLSQRLTKQNPEVVLKEVSIKKMDKYLEIKSLVQNKVIEDIDIDLIRDEENGDKAKVEIKNIIDSFLKESGINISRGDTNRIIKEIIEETLGYGPITPLLLDESVSEVMVNGPDAVYVERKGKLELSEVRFRDNNHVFNVIEKIVAPLGRRIDESSPMVDARLPDGSRVNAIVPPLALNGPTLTIRKFSEDPFKIDDLISFNTLSTSMARFIELCVKSRLNLVVSGGTGSGKTTTLNVLSSFIPNDERIITIEDAAELKLLQDHVVRLESRPPNIEGKGAITIRDLVKNSLRMRPDRIVVGEVRSGEALDMLQAMNTGHDGSLTTGHANTPRDMLSRLETMVLMAGMELPVKAIREQIASAVDLIVQQSRLRDGSRKITHITEVQGMEGDVIVTQDIFNFKQTGVNNRGKIAGEFKYSGVIPKFIDKLEGFSMSNIAEILR